MAERKIRVVVVDDSLFIRQVFTRFLNEDPAIEVVGTAEDPHEARQVIKSTNPDVVTLDVEMPKMDGITFLEKIMSLRPMPVVMASTLTQRGAETTLKALEIGAVDYVSKPTNPAEMENIRTDLVRKVKMASKVNVQSTSSKAAAASANSTAKLTYNGDVHKPILAIGASTGGVEAIREVLEALPANIPPIVITQHMPEAFTGSFAKRLDGIVAPTVVETVDGMPIKPGHVYIAKGSHHLDFVQSGVELICKHDDSPNMSGHKPSVDFMFKSLARVCPKRVVAAILTGMGRDGAIGLKELFDNGAKTIGQNETSCVVYGMPKAAMELGGVAKQHPLHQIAPELLKLAA